MSDDPADRPDEPRDGEEPAACDEPTADAREQPTADAREQPTADAREQPRDDRRPRQLLRSRGDRMIAGVAGGLGRYFSVDPVIFRIGFAVSVFFGGLGLLAYIALALFVPDDEGRPAPVERSRALMIVTVVVGILVALPLVGAALFWAHGGAWGLFGLALPVAIAIAVYAVVRQRGRPVTALGLLAALGIVLAATVGLVLLAVLAAFATATGHGLAAAIGVVAIGLVIAAAAFRGGARWLIAPAVALALGVGVAAAANLSFHGGIGDRDYRPVSFASIPTDGYRLGVGRLAVDLRGLDWRRHRTVDLRTELGVGEMVIAVPSRVCVEATAHDGVGEVDVAGQSASGVDVDNHQGSGSTATPRLRLDAHLDAGELRILNSDDASIGGHDFGPFTADDSALRDAESRACVAGAR
jgi:phage shock protein PspC (stress-responsive transcriptional regulator)